MSAIRIGVIGLGFGQYHVKTLVNLEGVRLVSVADQLHPDPDGYSQKYGVRTYQDGLEMLDKEKLDAVSLCVSPRWRLPLVQKAVQLGIPMYIEKPWASSLAQGRELALLCEKHQALVMTGFSFRYLPAIVKLRELIEGELGATWALNGEYVFDWLPPTEHWLWDPENGNGYFNENSCHLFDAVCYLMGTPVSVFADGAIFQNSPSAEMGSVILSFPNGAIASLTIGGLGASAFRNFPRINLITANGQAHLSGREHMWETLSWATRNRGTSQIFHTAPEALENTRYTYALRHFIECVQAGRLPTTSITEGMLAVMIAEAVYESARSGRKVQLSEYGVKGASL